MFQPSFRQMEHPLPPPARSIPIEGPVYIPNSQVLPLNPIKADDASIAVEHLRWLTILWNLEKLSQESMPSIPEKRHILLAYKLLQILWFSKLPERDHQTFTVYVRDRLPDDQDPHVVNGIFNTNSDEIAVRCTSLERPKWLTKEAKAIKVSLESFPYKVS